jgi:CheY-like chemotaxis protein
MQEYITQTSTLRTDLQRLRLTPFSLLVPLCRDAVEQSALGQKRRVKFTVTGEATEVDQDSVAGLAPILSHLLRTCLSDSELGDEHEKSGNTWGGDYAVWLDMRGVESEIVLEIGFSMTVHGGAIEATSAVMQRLKGTLSLQRNSHGGVSFLLTLPRRSGSLRCLLVRVVGEAMLVPVTQVWRIEDGAHEQLDTYYQLHDLLDLTPSNQSLGQPPAQRLQPILILMQNVSRKQTGIIVDEVVDEMEVVVKALPPHLQRPGLLGAAIDGQGRTQLLLDLPELIGQYGLIQKKGSREPSIHTSPTKILVADDSVYQRHSVSQTLKHADYVVAEASDGMDALEKLLENTPDVFLLDIEMPNLNGYDLLNIVNLYPELANVKIIMLTSRASEKHRRHAFALGADAYLTKPCPVDELLATVQKVLL